MVHLNFEDRLGRDFSDQNDLAKNIALLAIISEILIFKVRRNRKIIYILAAVVFWLIVLITGSISNFLILFIVSAFLLIFITKSKTRLFVAIGIVATISLFIIALQFPFMSYFKTRIDKMLNSVFSNGGNVDYSFIDRFNLAFYGLRLFSSKPLFGYGYDQVQYYTWGKNAFSHNNFIELLASFGVFGFISFEFILIFPIFKNWKKTDKEIAIFSLLYLFLFQLFLIIYRKKIEYFLIPLAFSLIEHPIYRGISFSLVNKKLHIKRFVEYGVGPSFKSYYSIDI